MLSAILLLGTAGLCLAGEKVLTTPKELERVEDALEYAAKEDTSREPMNRLARQDDPFYTMPKSHHLLQKLLPGNPPPQPPPAYWPAQPPQQQQNYQVRPSLPPSMPCLPPNNVQMSEGHLPSPQTQTSSWASVPYISGYRLTPIIGHKQIVVNDVSHNPGPVPCVDGTYTSLSYGHAKNAEDYLKPFEDAGYFMPPQDMSHQLKDAQEYQDKIDDLTRHAEHLQSLKNNVVNMQHS